MAIKIQRGLAILIAFYGNLIGFILCVTYYLYNGFKRNDSLEIAILITGICLYSMIKYLNKNGWDEIKDSALGCFGLIIVLLIISFFEFIYNSIFVK